MTFKQLQRYLQQHATLAACGAFLEQNAHALRTLFYQGLTDAPSGVVTPASQREFDAEQALIDLLNSGCGDELRSGTRLPPSVTALMIYFVSLCERAGFHQRVLQIAQTLPSGSLRFRSEALFHYKCISQASIDYTARFQCIVAALQTAWVDGNNQQKAQCEDLCIEYFCSAAVPGEGIGARNRAALLDLFTDPANVAEHQFLASARVADVLALPADRLPQERGDANARIAEAFYDEAALLLPVRPQPPQTPVCLETGHSHGGHCPPGLHAAREALAARYPTEFANTSFFVKQPLTAATYTEFNDTTKCMRYFRQYMPLHMPQIEVAVSEALGGIGFTRRRVHVVDIGGGPGTLYAVLASLLHRGLFTDYRFEVTLVEPSKSFHEHLEVIAEHVTHPNLSLRGMHACPSDQLAAHIGRRDCDWYFIANAITPIVKGAGTPGAAVDSLCATITSTRRDHASCLLTLAENTNSTDFDPVCAALEAKGLPCTLNVTSCQGNWLAGCRRFYVTGPMRPTRPRLKYACVPIPEGYSIP